MRSYGMYDMTRGLTLALFAGVVGVGLWGATQVGTATNGRFWVAMVVLAAAGLLLALATHVGTWTKGLRLRLSPGSVALGFLPVLVCVGWILIATQPANGWEQGRIESWSQSIGILGPIHAIGVWSGVLAFGFGLMVGLSLDGVPEPGETEAGYPARPRAVTAMPVVDEPVTAERRWTAQRGTMQPPARPGSRQGGTRVHERTRSD